MANGTHGDEQPTIQDTSAQRPSRTGRDRLSAGPAETWVGQGDGGPSGYGGGGGHSRPDETVLIRPGQHAVLAWLAITSGRHAGHLFRLDPKGTVIGSGGGSDIPLQDETVSGAHAKLWAEGGSDERPAFVIQDLASKNKTFVNGQEILKESLHDGDEILLGETKLVFKQV